MSSFSHSTEPKAIPAGAGNIWCPHLTFSLCLPWGEIWICSEQFQMQDLSLFLPTSPLFRICVPSLLTLLQYSQRFPLVMKPSTVLLEDSITTALSVLGHLPSMRISKSPFSKARRCRKSSLMHGGLQATALYAVFTLFNFF